MRLVNKAMSPTFTIITPLFNAERYFRETFGSVVKQTFTDFEWIVVDDCSTDGSLALGYIVDTGTDVYEWTKGITGNYLIDPLSNLIGSFLNNVSSTFSSVYNLITPNGRPE